MPVHKINILFAHVYPVGVFWGSWALLVSRKIIKLFYNVFSSYSWFTGRLMLRKINQLNRFFPLIWNKLHWSYKKKWSSTIDKSDSLTNRGFREKMLACHFNKLLGYMCSSYSLLLFSISANVLSQKNVLFKKNHPYCSCFLTKISYSNIVMKYCSKYCWMLVLGRHLGQR